MKDTYAILRTGGKQHCVAAGNALVTDRMPATPGQAITLGDVLFLKQGDTVSTGTPALEGVAVKATVIRHFRGPKVVVFKKRAKKGYKKNRGHRQDLTELRITEISKS